MQLTPEMRSFLEERRFAVLATVNPDGSVQQSVMWYRLRDDTIEMNTVAGRVKDHNMRRDPRVSICIEDGYRYLTITGKVNELNDDQQVARPHFLELARRYNPDKTDEEIHNDYPSLNQQERVIVVVSIENVVANGF